MTDNDLLERNKAVALRFKKSQGTKNMPTVELEVLAPNYNRARGGSFHLAANARDQDWPHPGMYLRSAFPDRVDVIEKVVAERDRVGLLFRINATHTGNYFGIAPTGRKLDIYECAFLRIENGQMVEGWFMMDEAKLLDELGAQLPRRKDGKRMPPAIPASGEDVAALVKSASGNKLAVLRAIEKQGFRDPALESVIADMRYRVEVMIEEGADVWLRGNVTGTDKTGKRVGVPAAVFGRVEDGVVTEMRPFSDLLGLRLQLAAPSDRRSS
jgi:predicted ester cyclase